MHLETIKELWGKRLSRLNGQLQHVIMMRDFIAACYPELVRSRYTKSLVIPNNLYECIDQHDSVDCWRVRNPDKRNYTYYSGHHNSYSRIDFILTTCNTYLIFLQ